MKRAPVIRVGDRVRVIEPTFVRRVGYALVWTELVSEFTNNEKVFQAMRLLGLRGIGAEKEFIRGVAKSAVRSRGFGGPERTLHTVTDERFRGTEAWVLEKRRAVTGTYYPASSGSWEYPEDVEPAFLGSPKTHVLLDLDISFGTLNLIEVKNVELVQRSPNENDDEEERPCTRTYSRIARLS